MASSLVGRFEHIPNRPRATEARPLLEKIASQVKPIMSSRSWKVGTLAEFLPANPALLGNNMNAGQRINLRLRPPGDPSNFYEYDQLVLVMLHELTHIEHGAHNASFYKLLGELEEEYWDLKRKGYSGEGFHGAGHHLPGLKLNEYEGRVKGLSAAQKRLDTQRKIGKGGVLGGLGTAGKTMKEVLAEAAERRIRDDKACHPESEGHAKEVEEEVRKATEESVGIDAADLAAFASTSLPSSGTSKPTQPSADGNRVSGLVTESPSSNADSSSQPIRKLSSKTPISSGTVRPLRPRSPKLTSNLATSTRSVVPLKPQHDTLLESPNGKWSCTTCTLLNPPLALTCEACASSRPRTGRNPEDEVWYCEFCGAGPREMEFWSCAECGWVRKWG
ncbi:MAG: hypothetical protein TREMPRED_005707 [Tremellales sp. Tagirdzhanova-0007]|nr:MAG: hypothetical protein TREMPRED_005707 [Tremellales sp. Tagirdzhanova-0007]